MAKKRIDIEIHGENLSKQAFDEVERDVAGLEQNAGKAGKESFVEFGAKALAAVGSVEAGVKSLTSVVRLFKGDAEGAVEALTQLPFGIGPAIGAIRDLADEFTNLETAIDRANKVIDEARFKSIENEMSLREQIGLEGLDPINRQREALRVEQENAIREIRDRALEAGGVFSVGSGTDVEIRGRDSAGITGRVAAENFNEELDAVRELFGLKMEKLEEDIAARQAAFTEQQRERNRKSIEEETARMVDAYQRRTDALAAEQARADQAWEEGIAQFERRERERQGIAFELSQAELKHAGRDLEAQVAQIREGFARRIDGTDDELSQGRLRRMRDLEIEGLLDRSESGLDSGSGSGSKPAAGVGGRGFSAPALSDRFLGIADRFSSIATPTEKVARNTEQLVAEQQRTRETIDRLRDELRQGQGAGGRAIVLRPGR